MPALPGLLPHLSGMGSHGNNRWLCRVVGLGGFISIFLTMVFDTGFLS